MMRFTNNVWSVLFVRNNILKRNSNKLISFRSRPFSTHEQESRLSENKKSEEARKTIAEFHPQIVKEVKEAVNNNPLVVVGMAQNPFVGKVRKLLDEANIKYKYLEYGSYLSQWKPRLAIKLWTGYPTFPQVFANGNLIGGYEDTKNLVNKGTLQEQLKGK